MNDLQAIKDRIVETMLPAVEKTGWSWELAEASSIEAGLQDGMCKAVFPDGLNDVVSHFSDMTDRKMTEQLDAISTEGIRVRDRIKMAVMARLDILEKMNARAAVKAATAYWTFPMRVFQGQRVLWRTADRIWKWAGDESQDYNHYTKRGLLSSLMVGTTLIWIENPNDRARTEAFLDRRIENIMAIGRTIGSIGSGGGQKMPSNRSHAFHKHRP